MGAPRRTASRRHSASPQPSAAPQLVGAVLMAGGLRTKRLPSRTRRNGAQDCGLRAMDLCAKGEARGEDCALPNIERQLSTRPTTGYVIKSISTPLTATPFTPLYIDCVALRRGRSRAPLVAGSGAHQVRGTKRRQKPNQRKG